MHKEESLISVIVPIYKIDRYIGRCIESLIDQTYENLEIILVDDGSRDRCPEICDLYAKKDSRIKVVHKENGGLVSARKAGLEASTGEYIGYVDGDDWVGPGFYEMLYTEMIASEADLTAAGHSRDLFEKSEHFYNCIPAGVYEGSRLDDVRNTMISYGDFYRPGIMTYVWNKLFKRNILCDVQMKVDDRISIGEDAAVTYPALMKCERLCITDNVAYHYRQREDSMLKQNAGFETEARKLKHLYAFMSSFAAQYDKVYRLQEQINDYVLGICIMRSGGGLPVERCIDAFSTYDNTYYGKNVVVYSAGTFGQQLVNRFKESKHCNVIGWIDDDYREYRRCCMDVDSVESITQRSFDYVLIATVDNIVGEKIAKRLLDYGISRKRILTVECPENEREELIKQYLKD
ncbi:glycosyltransferase family 2 protein [Ruminococcus gauvreauii]|uniref:Glycosyltransferase n=1 Tax=Ruminococcus gauvreauii TaxID=438033 RepID=A0ABY5VF65_9FIRM|nr:glycosyltransferase family 2 protein [Ruminococcus gauvreauii]UWP59044.1 glycosyltransferase [Ruminococcus gauvreauii]